MIHWILRPLTQADALCAAGWQYAAPYAVYNNPICEPVSQYGALCDEQGKLGGFFCTGQPARMRAAETLYAQRKNALDIRLVLHPQFIGKGVALHALERILTLLQREKAPDFFRITLHDWDAQALRVCRGTGFSMAAACEGLYVLERDERPFLEASVPLTESTEVYPGDPKVVKSFYLRKEDSGFDALHIAMGVHTGTHMDAPAHIGLPIGIESVTYQQCNGLVQLINFQSLCKESIQMERILIANAPRSLTPAEASMLCQCVTFVGIDRFSVGDPPYERETHRILLEAGIIILENARLQGFAEGFYEMRCMPLYIPGSDGSPVRLLLRKEAQ